MIRCFYVVIILTLTLIPFWTDSVHGSPHETEYFITWGTAYSVSPVSGTSYHLTRKVDQFGKLVGGTYSPSKPPDRAFFTASIVASGLGKVSFTFSEGSSHTKKVGDWGHESKFLGATTWFETEQNKEVDWFQAVVFPCWRVKEGHHPGDITAPIDTSRIYRGTPHRMHVTSTMVPKAAVLQGVSSSFQITLGKTPSGGIRMGSGWRMDSRSAITKEMEAEWHVTFGNENVITCMHTNCTKIVPTAVHHSITCLLDDGMYKGCGGLYWLCQPEVSLHKLWPCVICGDSFKPCTPEGHEVWVDGPCPATFIIDGVTVSCDADPNGYYKCIHTHNFPDPSTEYDSSSTE